jgi:hypothetical protein
MPRYRNPDSEHQIKRIDSKPLRPRQTHGFQVHFRRGDTTWTKFFSDGIHGGKEEARAEARKFREYLERTIPEAKAGGAIRASAVGYSFRERHNTDGTVTRYISASAHDRKGHGVNKAFRIEADDLDAAIQEALRWRLSVVEQRLQQENIPDEIAA